jgi:DNA-binding NtrC family response regulator
LSTFFLREASERLGKPDVRLSPDTLDLFDAFNWPGNVRQLRNEIQRAVAMARPGTAITPELLSPMFVGGASDGAPAPRRVRNVTLGAAVGVRAGHDRIGPPDGRNVSQTAQPRTTLVAASTWDGSAGNHQIIHCIVTVSEWPLLATAA